MYLWICIEYCLNECCVGIIFDGVCDLIVCGFCISIEESLYCILLVEDFIVVGVILVFEGSWFEVLCDVIIFGLKELFEDGIFLLYCYIMFGYVYKGQVVGFELLCCFCDGGGVLLDLEYLIDVIGCCLVVFGYWVGFVGVVVLLKVWVV